jgi:Na+/H+ antiporter NhaD/arsenite permease-like protein
MTETINPAESIIALFFGGMVVVRTLIATGLFDYLGAIVRWSRLVGQVGSGFKVYSGC